MFRKFGELVRSVVVVSASALGLLVLSPGAHGQTPPGYIGLFQDPPATGQLTPADLPNMGRLVVLESISMFVHARSELRNSPASARLLDQITTLWNAADAFTSAVSYGPELVQNIETGRLVYPQLALAFEQVRDTQGAMPRIGPRSAENLADMSRVMAVIGPLLNEPLPAQPAVVNPGTQESDVIAAGARELATAMVPFKTQVNAFTTRGARPQVRPEVLARQIDLLERLIQGFEQIAAAGAGQSDLVAAFRPIRNLAQAITRGFRLANLGQPETNLWRSIDQQIVALETRFQIPREIVVRPPGKQRDLPDPAIVAPADRAIHEAEILVQRIGSQTLRLSQPDRSAADARELATRLLLVRQCLLGQAPAEQINQAVVAAEISWRQLESRMTRPGQPTPGALQELKQDVNQAVQSARQQITRHTGNSAGA